jgi:methyl-accepting chemotaxis protein
MHVPIGYKFILGFVVVVATVAFVPDLVKTLGYSPEMTSILAYVVALTTGLILGWFFSRTLSRNIGVITSSTEAISQGDLTREIRVHNSKFPDETQEMALAINLMAESLRDLVRHIRDTSTRVSESARTLSSSALEINASTEEVADAIEQISHGAESQAEMVGRSSKVIHEMAISVELVAKRAKESAKAARETSLTAQRGVELANDSLELTKNFFADVEQSSRQFAELNKKLQQVGKIADFIAEIARQTNMLALNASIEAVRAGEFGKGFAVVAEEVRKLADGTSKSAAEIIELIGLLKEESHRVHDTFAESSRHIKEGKKNIDTTAGAFQAIVQTVLETERKANSIADLSQMQTDGAQKMVEAIDEISRVTQDNAASTEQVSAATEEQSAAMQEMVHSCKELAELADELLQSVSRFKTPAEETTSL